MGVSMQNCVAGSCPMSTAAGRARGSETAMANQTLLCLVSSVSSTGSSCIVFKVSCPTPPQPPPDRLPVCCALCPPTGGPRACAKLTRARTRKGTKQWALPKAELAPNRLAQHSKQHTSCVHHVRENSCHSRLAARCPLLSMARQLDVGPPGGVHQRQGAPNASRDWVSSKEGAPTR